MTTTEINVLLTLRKKSITKMARAIKEDRVAVSYTINYQRENPRIRQKIADYLGMPVDELFDPFSEKESVAA